MTKVESPLHLAYALRVGLIFYKPTLLSRENVSLRFCINFILEVLFTNTKDTTRIKKKSVCRASG